MDESVAPPVTPLKVNAKVCPFPDKSEPGFALLPPCAEVDYLGIGAAFLGGMLAAVAVCYVTRPKIILPN